MTVRVYRSTDANAPILSGTAGSLIVLLDACLVTGYGDKAAAGWTKAYSSGSTIAAYKTGVGSNGMCWYMDDTEGRFGRMWGYEQMTSITSGVGRFPTDGQLGGGCYLYKSDSYDNIARMWMMVVTEKAAHLWTCVQPSQTINQINYAQAFFFGDIQSFRPNDAFGTIIIGHSQPYSDSNMPNMSSSIIGVNSGHYIARGASQYGQSAQVGKNNSYVVNSYRQQYPAVTDGAAVFDSLIINDPTCSSIRGNLPGLWMPQWPKDYITNMFVDGQQFTFSSGDLAGKTFEIKYVYSSYMAYEVSDTW